MISEHFKKGYTTTEFWVAVVSAAVSVAAAFGIELDPVALAGLAPAVAYILGRSYLKGQRVRALEVEQEDSFTVVPVGLDK